MGYWTLSAVACWNHINSYVNCGLHWQLFLAQRTNVTENKYKLVQIVQEPTADDPYDSWYNKDLLKCYNRWCWWDRSLWAMIYGCQSLVTTTYKRWILRKCMEEVPENGTLRALFGRVCTAGVNRYQQSYPLSSSNLFLAQLQSSFSEKKQQGTMTHA